MPLLPAELPTAHAARALRIPYELDRYRGPDTDVPPFVPPLHEAIGRRRSVRDFAPEPVSPETVTELLRLAWAIYRAHFTVDLHVLVAGLDPAESWLPDLRAAYAPAPAFLLICGDVASRPAAWATGLSHAGAFGHALWLAATHLELGACAFGGTSGRITAVVQRRDPALRHLFTLALGHRLEVGSIQ